MTRTRALFCDFLGLPKGKYIPSDLAKSGDITDIPDNPPSKNETI